MAIAPPHILSVVNHNNPAGPHDFNDDDGAARIAGGVFPQHSALEWRQVLGLPDDDPDSDYDIETVAACGWLLDKQYSGADFPFDHPFGFDWEFMLAVDRGYSSLLARGNQFPEDGDEVLIRERDLEIPIVEGKDGAASLLGVEIDGGLVPTAFTGAVTERDRMAVLGRWIVDCGHAVKIPAPHGGVDTYRAEIHPPLFMAAAKVTTASILSGNPTGPEVTRVLFTSRPYLVSQRYTTDLDSIYDDRTADDGTFWAHITKEVSKVGHTLLGFIPLDSTQVEAHPKIKSHPFKGIQAACFRIRPPTLDPSPSDGRPNRGGTLNLPAPKLVVSFQFSVRTGCAVEVNWSGSNSVDVVVVLNDVTYKSLLPDRTERVWTKEQLDAIRPGTSSDISWGEALTFGLSSLSPAAGGVLGAEVAHLLLEKGVKTDEYDTSQCTAVDILDAHHAVANADAANIPVGQGIRLGDDIQPYPFFGWLELRWDYPMVRPALG